MILCLWSPLHPLSKLLVIQDHAQNLEEQLGMEEGRAVSILSHRPVTSSDLKQERSFFRWSVSTFLQLVVAMPLGLRALTFCFLRATSCSSYLMILLEDDLPAPVFFGQVSFVSYLPSKKIYLPLTTRWDFQLALLSGSRIAYCWDWLGS